MEDNNGNSHNASDNENLAEAFREALISGPAQAELDDELVNMTISGKLSSVRILLRQGANPNADHSLAMCIAVSREDIPMLEAFLAAGKASVPNETPLFVAVTERKWQMAAKLIEHGANVEALAVYIAENGSDFHREAFSGFQQHLGKQKAVSVSPSPFR